MLQGCLSGGMIEQLKTWPIAVLLCFVIGMGVSRLGRLVGLEWWVCLPIALALSWWVVGLVKKSDRLLNPKSKRNQFLQRLDEHRRYLHRPLFSS